MEDIAESYQQIYQMPTDTDARRAADALNITITVLAQSVSSNSTSCALMTQFEHLPRHLLALCRAIQFESVVSNPRVYNAFLEKHKHTPDNSWNVFDLYAAKVAGNLVEEKKIEILEEERNKTLAELESAFTALTEFNLQTKGIVPAHLTSRMHDLRSTAHDLYHQIKNTT